MIFDLSQGNKTSQIVIKYPIQGDPKVLILLLIVTGSLRAIIKVLLINALTTRLYKKTLEDS